VLVLLVGWAAWLASPAEGGAASRKPARECTGLSIGKPKPSFGDEVRTVPVVLHVMTPEPPSAGADPSQVPATVRWFEELFREAARGPVNELWLPAGIQFYLHRAERCAYLRTAFPDLGDDRIPRPFMDDLTAFRDVNDRYNARDVVGVDLYVWPRIDGVSGFATASQTRGDFPGPGALWTHQLVVGSQDFVVVAHELGHFLGLAHSCKAPGSTTANPQKDPDNGKPDCPAFGQSSQLMSALADGKGLTCEEMKQAHAAARIFATRQRPEQGGGPTCQPQTR
jgi:hypothetical protein